MTDKKIRILLVEDHEFTRLGLAMKIESTQNMELVAQATNGQDAIFMAQQYNPDVILMDIGLPLIDGIAATRKIKEELKLDCAVLMFTSRDSRQDVFAAFKAGADGYIMKDSSSSNLINAIEAVSSHCAWIDSQIAKVVLSSIETDSDLSKEKSQAKKNMDSQKKNSRF